jgi:hypothetical protein
MFAWMGSASHLHQCGGPAAFEQDPSSEGSDLHMGYIILNALPSSEILGPLRRREKSMSFSALGLNPAVLPEQDVAVSAQVFIQNIYTAMNSLLLSCTQWDWAYWTKKYKDGFDGINLSVVDQDFNIRSNYLIWPYVQVKLGVT